MSVNGLQQQYIPPSLDGLTVIDADQIYIDGTLVDLDNLVPYTGASQMVDLGSQKIRSTWSASNPADLINKDVLDTTISNLTIAISGTFVDKLTGTNQTMNAELQAPAFTATGRLAVWDAGSRWYNTRVEIMGEDYIVEKDDGVNPIATILRYDLSATKWVYPEVTASRVAIFDVDKGLVSSTVTPTTLSYLDIGSSLTSLLSQKANLAGPQTFTGTHTFNNPNPINLTGLIGNRILGLGTSQEVTTVSVTLLEASYLSGVTSAIQTQIDGKASTSYVDTQVGLRVLKAGDTMTGTLALSGANFIDFGFGVVGKEANAGRMGYQTFATGCLDIVGAGTTSTNRRLRVYDMLGVGVTPSYPLSISGSSYLNGNVGINWIPETGVDLRLANSVANRRIVLFSSYTDDHRYYGMGINNFTYRFNIQDATTDRFGFFAGTGSTTSTEVFTVAGTGDVTMTGNVGIGTAPSTVRALRIARSYTMDFDLKSLISFENTAVGAAYTHWEVGPNVFGGRSRFTIRGGTKNFNTLINYFNLEDNGRATLTGVLNVTGGNPYALPNNLTTTPGSLILGDTTTNYGGGWNAGLMMECLDTTEISIHDSGNRLASFMYYAGSSFTIGRDIGNGVTPTFFAGNVTVNGTTNLVGTTTTRSLTLVNTHTLNVSNGNGTDGQIMLGWQGSQSQYRHRITTNHDGGAGPTGNSNSMSFYLWSTNDAVGAVGTNQAMTLAGGGVGFGTTNPLAKVHVSSGDGSKILYGPNASWGTFLSVGAGGSGVTTNTAQMICTNGNLHIDAALAKDIYLGLYPYLAGQANKIFSYGSWRHYNSMMVGSDLAPSGTLHVYSTTADYTNTCYIQSPWASVTLNNIGTGRQYSILTGGPGAGVGAGNFGIFDITGGSYRFSIVGNGSIGLGSFNPHVRVGVNGGNTGGNVLNTSAWPTDGNGILITAGNQSATADGLYVGHQNFTGYITCLQPTVSWDDLYISAATTYFSYFGNVVAVTTSGGIANVSDQREKEDIQDLKTSKSLDRVLALRPKHYRRKFDDVNTPVPEEEIQRRHVGFIAQEVQQTNPHCVSSWCKKSGKKAKKCEKPDCKVEEEILGCCKEEEEEEPEEPFGSSASEEDEEDEMRLGMSYNDYIVHLVGGMQEQQKQIQVLEERNKVLEAHARKLETDFGDYKTQTEERFNKLATLIASLK